MIDLSQDEVLRQFKKNYNSSNVLSGKNYLAFEIAKQFVLNFLNYEISILKTGKKIIIKGLEVPLEIEHFVDDLGFKVKLKGKIDRIDEVDGVMRITDYKTGKVLPGQLKIKDWSQMTTDEKYDKSFQVLTYAHMYLNSLNFSFDSDSIESGIISFKNLKDGFMPFNGSALTEEIMATFLCELDKLLIEIFDPQIPFIEKEQKVFNY